ncbi:MAG: class I SAM-dependent DNA methyltransferase [Paludibacteraceae bacterium]|nr:class I SAM-dependent DNA methyltransferase [Paludibacteraceae bacterium]
MTAIQQQKAAREFAQQWQGKGNEKSDTHSFWFQLLRQVFGVESPEQYVEVEKPVSLDHTSYIDVYIPSTKVLIEQKSIDKDLNKGYKQSDDQTLTPYQQAKRYANELPRSEHPKWIITCNFQEFHIYDMDRPHDAPLVVLLKDLEKDYYLLKILVDEKDEHLKREMEVSFKAGNLVGIIYDKLLEQYIDKDSVATLKSLNILCVRLVFCLYAEDANLFGSKTAFHDYLAQFPANQLRRALIDLFQVLDTPPEQRDPYLDETLQRFPYVNGGLFSSNTTAGGAPIVIPQFTDELKQLLLDKASADFDWSEISPTIFGAVFESTINPETRRSGGMHYTSIENIHKVIDPLFLDELRDEFESIKAIAQERQQRQRLDAFQEKLASLTFFDPACGSGNFLTESYISLRRLENEVILLRNKGQAVMGDIANPIKVDIHQFYGIEINDFAVSVATTALWIAEHQMLKETAKLVQFNIEPLPLKSYHNIHEGNALRLDWDEVIAPDKLNYIMGNPPFVGYSLQTKEQKEDVLSIFIDEKGKPYKTAGKIDYVAAWYWKAAQMMITNPAIHAALVSTNSITQGEQVAAIWQPLFERFNLHLDFAYRTFRWDSEADIKAHVHCVIRRIGHFAGCKRVSVSLWVTLQAGRDTPLKTSSFGIA